MFGEYSIHVLFAVMMPCITAMIILSWPWKRVRRYVVRHRIDAPRDRVWKIYFVDLDDPESAALYSILEGARHEKGDPSISELVQKAEYSGKTDPTVIRYRILENQPPGFVAIRAERVGDMVFADDEMPTFSLTLTERDGGTEAVFDWRGPTCNLWQFLSFWRGQRRFIRTLGRICESGVGAAKVATRRTLWISLALTAAAIGSFALIFHWLAAALLCAALIVHEFGHWLAFRMTGHAAPRMMLIPFFGGIAVGDRPHKSLFDSAFVALMGPGISVLPCAGLLVTGYLLGAPDIEKALEIGKNPEALPQAMVLLALAVGALNLLQLLPVLPLDGGQILRAFVQSFGVKYARPVLIGLATCGVIGFAYLGDYIIVGILVLGAVEAWHMRDAAPDARPMGAGGAITIGIGYAAVTAVHTFAVVYAFWLLRIDPAILRIELF